MNSMMAISTNTFESYRLFLTESLPNTLILIGVILGVSCFLGMFLMQRKKKNECTFCKVVLTSLAVPAFWVGLMLKSYFGFAPFISLSTIGYIMIILYLIFSLVILRIFLDWLKSKLRFICRSQRYK